MRQNTKSMDRKKMTSGKNALVTWVSRKKLGLLLSCEKPERSSALEETDGIITLCAAGTHILSTLTSGHK